jgi:starch phosphorylase
VGPAVPGESGANLASIIVAVHIGRMLGHAVVPSPTVLVSNDGGTEGSNPASSTGESAANFGGSAHDGCAGLLGQWLERVLRSMAELAPVYSSSRMARDYLERYYLPGTAELRRRVANGGEPAREMRRWEVRLRPHWPDLHIGKTTVSCNGTAWSFSVSVNLGEIAPEEVAVQLYAERRNGEAPFVSELCSNRRMPGPTPAQRR